ncbi:hypothetical protein KEM55_006380 [Ascosphaera atra]|nr:hypothetical protein KEM55_006380 [Ascosphaera atra]
MASMVNTKEMSKYNVPIGLICGLQHGKQMRSHAIVNRMQVPNIERVISVAEVLLEDIREQGLPSIVTEMHDLLASFTQLRHKIGINDYDDGFVEGLVVPAPLLWGPIGASYGLHLVRYTIFSIGKNRAGRFIVENHAREEESFGEVVDAREMDEPAIAMNKLMLAKPPIE